MKTPLFLTSSASASNNWFDAFPGAQVSRCLPDKFDNFDSSIIFVDYFGLAEEQKYRWLAKSVATGRKVVVLSPTPSSDEAIAVVKNGAVGYGHTLASTLRLREIALVVNYGGLWIGSQLLKRVVAALGSSKYLAQSVESANNTSFKKISRALSNREMAVAEQVAIGATNREICQRLDIRERTVKAHITSIFGKLNVRNRVELALVLNNVQIPHPSIDNQSKRPAL